MEESLVEELGSSRGARLSATIRPQRFDHPHGHGTSLWGYAGKKLAVLRAFCTLKFPSLA